MDLFTGAEPIAKLADITCFSFYPGKNLGAYGDAGALVTDNQEWADRARIFANHGEARKYEHQVEGINSRLDGIQAGILSVKLKYLNDWTRQRCRNATLYSEKLEKLGVIRPVEIENVKAVYHLYVIRVEAEIRSKGKPFGKPIPAPTPSDFAGHRIFSRVDKGSWESPEVKRSKPERIGSPHTRCRQPGFRSGWIRRSPSICAGRRRTGRPSPGKRSSGKRISRATMKSCGLGFVSWKAVCTAVEASVGLARARIRRGARSGRALGDSSRGVGDMGEAAWRGWKPGRKWRICPKRSRRVPAAAGPWIRFRGPMTPRWWRSRPGSGVG